MGYMRAGFEVFGMDINPQPNYPFRFIQGNVLNLDPGSLPLMFDAIAGSPPCQHYSTTASLHSSEHPDLVVPTRELFKASGLPYIIENVPGAPLLGPVILCGSSFALPIRRHRLFESNVRLSAPPCDHEWQNRHKPYVIKMSIGRGGSQTTGVVSVHGDSQHGEALQNDSLTWRNDYNLWQASVALGIDWMKTKHEVNQSIPPAYTYYLGKQLLRAVEDLWSIL